MYIIRSNKYGHGKGLVTAQAISHRGPGSISCSPCSICGEQSGAGANNFLSTSVLTYQLSLH
jgi:hypothetical protein